MSHPTKVVAAAFWLALMAGPGWAEVDTSLFGATAFAVEPAVVDCTLENGDATQCHKLVVSFKPSDLEIGPFCPATLNDSGGIWNWDGTEYGLFRIDGDFLRKLAAAGYQMYDDAGNVFSFDIRVEGPSKDNSCIAGSVDDTVTMTVLLPTEPVLAASPTPLGTVAKVGLGLDGVPIFADAPEIAQTGHMPALDTCGGHVDPGGWYHWHATSSDIDSVFGAAGVDAACAHVPQDPTALFAYAFDGHAIYGSLEQDGSVPTGLDDCGGHIGPTAQSAEPVYHYHSATEFPNLPKCMTGVVAEGSFSTTAEGGIGSERGEGGPSGPGGPGGGPPDFAQIAETLGVEPRALQRALRDAGGPRADLAEVAKVLGVTEEALRAALPPRP
jgi:YHYH protein